MIIRRSHQGISLLKGISCIIVVFLHASFPGTLGKIIGYFLNFSVPVFFIISGYFAYNKNDILWVRKKMLFIIKYTLLAELICGLWLLFRNCILLKISLYELLSENNIVLHPIRTIFTGTIFNGTLWYMYAMIWLWVIYYILIKTRLLQRKFTYLLIPFLTLLAVFGRLIYQNHHDISDHVFLFRNMILPALPMALLGSWIASNQASLQKFFSPFRSFLLICFGFFLTVPEYVISHRLVAIAGMDFHISTVVISFGLFLYFLNYKNISALIMKPFIFIGSSLYLWVYLLHYPVLSIVLFVGEQLNIMSNSIFSYAFPLICLGLSCLFSYFVYLSQNALSKRSKSEHNSAS